MPGYGVPGNKVDMPLAAQIEGSWPGVSRSVPQRKAREYGGGIHRAEYVEGDPVVVGLDDHRWRDSLRSQDRSRHSSQAAFGAAQYPWRPGEVGELLRRWPVASYSQPQRVG